MSNSANIILIGEESAGVHVLKVLAASDHRIAAVMSTPATGDDPVLWNAAQRLGLTTWPAELVRTKDFAATIQNHDIDVVLNVHSLHIINDAVLKACRIGAFNMHPGPLPELAGLNVPSWAIYNLNTTHGVTIHKMERRIDAGRIAYETRFPIAPHDTGLTLSARCIRAGIPLIRQLLTDLASRRDRIPLLSQDVSKRTYYGSEPPNAGRLVWDRPAVAVLAHIRAADFGPFASPWGRPVASIAGKICGVLKAQGTSRPTADKPGTIQTTGEDNLEIATLDEWIHVQSVETNGRVVNPIVLI